MAPSAFRVIIMPRLARQNPQMLRRFGNLPVVAEDPGTIDADVRDVMQRYGLPGMRVLQFAFGDDFPESSFLPRQHIRDRVIYTGMHDNNTVVGWLRTEAGELGLGKRHFFNYPGRGVSAEASAWEMIRMAMQSVADTVIIPLQDRWAWMNRPVSTIPPVRKATGVGAFRPGNSRMRPAGAWAISPIPLDEIIPKCDVLSQFQFAGTFGQYNYEYDHVYFGTLLTNCISSHFFNVFSRGFGRTGHAPDI